MKWKPTDKGYVPHVIAAFAEWTTMFCLNFFLLSYTREMHKISLSSPKVFITVDNVNIISDQNESEFYQNEDQVEINTRVVTNNGIEYNQNIIS